MSKQKGPWSVTSARVVYKNPWMEVVEDAVIRPNGEEGVFSVAHFHNGISVIPMDSEGNVYLTKEYRYAIERVSVEAASGSIDVGETPLRAAQRELKEETGLVAKKWTHLGVFDPFTSAVKSEAYLYLAEDLEQHEAEPESTEIIEVIKLPFTEAIHMVKEGTITHGATIVALLMIQNR